MIKAKIELGERYEQHGQCEFGVEALTESEVPKAQHDEFEWRTEGMVENDLEGNDVSIFMVQEVV